MDVEQKGTKATNLGEIRPTRRKEGRGKKDVLGKGTTHANGQVSTRPLLFPADGLKEKKKIYRGTRAQNRRHGTKGLVAYCSKKGKEGQWGKCDSSEVVGKEKDREKRKESKCVGTS